MKLKTVLLSFFSLFCLFVFSENKIFAAENETKLIPNVDFVPNQLELFDQDDSTFIKGNGTYKLFNEFNYKLNDGEYFKFVLKTDMTTTDYPFIYVSGTNENIVRYDSVNISNKLIYYTLPSEFDERISFRMSGDSGFRKFLELEVFVVSVPDNIPPSKISNVQHVFNEDNSITYSYDFPTDSDFSHLEIYQGSSLLNEKFTNNSIKITDLVPLINYTFKFISVDKSGNKSEAYESIITMPEGPDLIPPLEISNLKHIVSDTSVQFNYSLPIDDDFSHIEVWRGNEQIADNVRINSFKDESLEYETSYNYVFKTVDFSGNVSNGSSLTIKTMPYKDDIPPVAPVGLEVITGNSSLSFSWIPNVENDVLGYNIYVDDVKINGSVISGNSYRLTNLTNGNDYKIQVSAVDTSGNESERSNTIIGVPDESKLPVFKVDTDLKSVAESTENWFSELWLVLAFSSSIPIAFLVGHRIKNLFFA